MSDTKWTPGPWRTIHGGQTIFIDASIGGGMAQEVAACSPTHEWEHQAHNAHLIAAAPEMYSLLSQYVEAFSDKTRGCNLEKVALAALAKARGES